MVKSNPAVKNLLLTVCGITIAGYLLLLALKIVATVRQEGFHEPAKGDHVPVFYFTYSSEPGCTHCRNFEPIWDDFVKKSAHLFKEALITPQKISPKLSHKTSSHDYPDVALVNADDPTTPMRFEGPYTTQGLMIFVQQFESRHPNRVARVQKYRKEHSEYA